MDNGSITIDDRAKQSEPEKKDAETITISLRPGGGGISLRPGGGFNFGAKTTSLVPSTKPFKSASSSDPPSVLDLGKDPVTSVSTKSQKEDFIEEDRPDGFQTNEEKCIYNRQYILQFQTAHTELPDGLQFIFLEVPELQRDSSVNSSRGPFSGSKASRNQSTNRIQSGQRQNNNKMNQMKGQTQQPLPRRAKDRWEPRPSFLKDERDQVLRSITGTLNKITPEKFDKLSIKLCKEIESIVEEDIYSEAVSLVFSKAVSEPNFSKMYAELCVKLNAQPVNLPDPKVNFKRVLLNKCQDEFESTYVINNKNLSDDPEERFFKLRRRKLGNVKFIGELFKSKLLSEKIVEECIRILLDPVDKSRDKETVEHHCELICKLMTTIGKLLDQPKSKSFMQKHFDQFTRLSQDENLSSRIRFMFQDLLDLRSNNWIPRREENTPKTFGEVHAEALAKQIQDEIFSETKSPSTTIETKGKISQSSSTEKKDPNLKKKKKNQNQRKIKQKD